MRFASTSLSVASKKTINSSFIIVLVLLSNIPLFFQPNSTVKAIDTTVQFTIYHLSDSLGTNFSQTVQDYINTHGGDCIIVTGDLSSNGVVSEYMPLKNFLGNCSVPYMVTRGNHDDDLANFKTDAVFFNGTSGKYGLADASANSTLGYGNCGVAVSNATNGGLFLLLREGRVANSGWSFTAGYRVYVSTVAGDLTETAPSGSGDYVYRVGWAWNSTVVEFAVGSVDYVQLT